MGLVARKSVFGGMRTTQSDQRLCYSPIGKYHIQTCHKRNFNFLSNLISGKGLFGSHFVRNPEDRFCRNGPYYVEFYLGFYLAVERLPALHCSVDFIFLSFWIMGFIVEL